MAEEEAPAVGPVTEEWVYLGQDFDLTQRWRTPSGQLVYYAAKLKAKVPGGIYRMRVTREGTTTRTYGGVGAFVGLAEDAAEIQAAAQRMDLKIKVKRLEANTTRTGAIDATLTDLLKLASKLVNMQDRRALAEYVTMKIHTA